MPMEIAQHLRALEEHLLDPAVRKDRDTVANLLTEDFREFGSSGRTYSRAEILEYMCEEAAAAPQLRISLADFEVTPLSGTLALVTYRSRREQPGQPARESLRSSLWSLRDGRWQMLFHQGTSLPAPEPQCPSGSVFRTDST